jgi:hypothetical protein
MSSSAERKLLFRQIKINSQLPFVRKFTPDELLRPLAITNKKNKFYAKIKIVIPDHSRSFIHLRLLHHFLRLCFRLLLTVSSSTSTTSSSFSNGDEDEKLKSFLKEIND